MRFKLTALMGIFIIALVFNTSFFVEPVSASEEEEFDGFNQMPNYRYENQTTTSGVTEQLIGDQYETYAFNNETTGTSNLEKSRKLNSRDFRFDSRFALDVGGNQTEYFRDTLGVPVDFNIDDGSWSGGNGGALTVVDGIAINTRSVIDSTVTLVFNGDMSNIQTSLYNTLVVTFKGNGLSSNLVFRWSIDGGVKFTVVIHTGTIPLIWTTAEIDLSGLPDWGLIDSNNITDFELKWSSGGIAIVYVDTIQLFGDLDFATAVEGEIEDTWDWEDSVEWSFDTLGNISDFEDSTIEYWNISELALDVETIDGGQWLEWGSDTGSPNANTNLNSTSSLSIDASIYEWFTFEYFWNSSDNVQLDNITVFDVANNQIAFDNTSMPAENTKALFSEQFDADWSGTETFIRVRFQMNTTGEIKGWFNFTFLYDVELGDIESYTGTNRGHVNPNGYLTTAGTGSVVFITVPTIDLSQGDQFTVLKFSLQIFTDIRLRVRTTPSVNTLVADFQITGSVSFQDFQFIIDSSLLIDETGFHFRIDQFDTNEIIQFDYILLLGHWSETDGYKFSLLNQDSDEGMYFQFTNSGSEPGNYTIHIDMLDISGIALSHETDFQYDFNTDGFLRLDVDWHLEKKEVKVNLFYENGSTIIKTRDITELYSDLGSGQLILLKNGFPQLCLNNSVGAIARSLVIIDYIDADWFLTNWIQTIESGTGVTDFSAYSYRSYQEEVAFHEITHALDVDRFDGVSLDMEIDTQNIEFSTDFARMSFTFYTVFKNGSIDELFKARIAVGGMGGTQSNYELWNRGVLVANNTDTNLDVVSKLSIFRENNKRFDMQFRHDDLDDNIHTVAEIIDEDFSIEVYMTIHYSSDNQFGGFVDDEISMQMTGFDVIRKDILADLPGIGMSPVGVFGFIYGIFATFFTWLGGIFGVVFDTAVAIIEPILSGINEALNSILAVLQDILTELLNIGNDVTSILTAITVGIQNALDNIVTDIGLVLTAITVDIQNALDDIVTDIGLILAEILVLAAGIWTAFIAEVQNIINAILAAILVAISLLWDIISEVVFFVWDALGLPDLLAIANLLLVGFIQLVTDGLGALEWLIDVINVWKNGIFFLGTILLLAIPAFMSKGPGEFMDNFTRWNSWNILPISIFGINVHIPVGIVFWPLEFLVLFEMAG